MSLHGKSAISSQNNPLVSVLPYPDIVWNARSRKFKKQEIQTMVACKMSNIFCPQTRNYFKKRVLSKCNFFFQKRDKKLSEWLYSWIARLSPLVCTSATVIMAVLAMTPMIIKIQILVLMRSDAFKKPWSSVVETKDWSVRLAVCTATVFFEVKFST